MIIFSDEFSEWKDSSGSTAAAGQAERAAKMAAEDTQKAKKKAERKAAETAGAEARVSENGPETCSP